jgi:hypothetical protein
MAKPKKVFRIGTVSASIFVNQRKNKAGEKIEIPSISFQKRYQDRNPP